MPRVVQSPDPLMMLKTGLRAAEHAASEIVLAVEALRAALRQVAAAVDDLPRDQPASRPRPMPLASSGREKSP